MKAHGLIERIGRAYSYRLSDKGTKAALLFILFLPYTLLCVILAWAWAACVWVAEGEGYAGNALEGAAVTLFWPALWVLEKVHPNPDW